MNTSANNRNALAKTLAAAVILAIVAVLMLASIQTSSSAAFQERTFENRIPTHIPIKIKIKKEKEQRFKELNNEKWLREFELEVTNTGDKPIYFLYIMLGTNVKDKQDGLELMYPLTYGRAELGDIVTKATNDDIPIKPGETKILSLGEVPAWEKDVREKRWPQSTKFTADIQSLSFGDGTGDFGTKPYPPTGRRQATLDYKRQSPTTRSGPSERITRKSTPSRSSSNLTQPTFLSADFLSSDSVSNRSVAQPAVTCPLPECTPLKPFSGHVCYDNENRESCRLQNRPTFDDISGVCMEQEFGKTECVAGTVTYFCQTIRLFDCGFGPAPTPTPSPGTIDNGQELFGDLTPQPAAPAKNGFLALAEFNKSQMGGNGDGVIDRNDAIFEQLRLWQDRNHNGVSEPGELQVLQNAGLVTIELEYKLSKKVDIYGNEFKYRAKVKDAKKAKIARWAWDVFLQSVGL